MHVYMISEHQVGTGSVGYVSYAIFVYAPVPYVLVRLYNTYIHIYYTHARIYLQTPARKHAHMHKHERAHELTHTPTHTGTQARSHTNMYV